MAGPTTLGYLSITLPGRDNVREPMQPPEMRLVRGPKGAIATVRLNEAQLLAIIKDATTTLDWMRQCRGTTECPMHNGHRGQT